MEQGTAGQQKVFAEIQQTVADRAEHAVHGGSIPLYPVFPTAHRRCARIVLRQRVALGQDIIDNVLHDLRPVMLMRGKDIGKLIVDSAAGRALEAADQDVAGFPAIRPPDPPAGIAVFQHRAADRTDRARFLTQTEKYSRSC